MELVCANEGCDNVFVQRTHNMKYCSDACCKLATNRRIMEDYYEDRARLKGVARWCSKCEKTRLSRYNTTKVCASCRAKSELDAKNSVIEMLTNASLTA